MALACLDGVAAAPAVKIHPSDGGAPVEIALSEGLAFGLSLAWLDVADAQGRAVYSIPLEDLGKITYCDLEQTGVAADGCVPRLYTFGSGCVTVSLAGSHTLRLTATDGMTVSAVEFADAATVPLPAGQLLVISVDGRNALKFTCR